MHVGYKSAFNFIFETITGLKGDTPGELLPATFGRLAVGKKGGDNSMADSGIGSSFTSSMSSQVRNLCVLMNR